MLANSPKIHIHPSASKPILLVEDERVNMEFLNTILSDAGYTVDQAKDGVEAWEKLSHNNHYAAVVTDRIMPGMDGLELAQRIHNNTKTRLIPVIMQTGATAPKDVSEGIQSGIYYYLTKPFEEKALLGIVNAAIRDRQKQEIFTTRLDTQQNAMAHLTEAHFQIATLSEAQNTAFLVGSLFPNTEFAVAGLYELILNAIEHGNLEIGYDLKNELLSQNAWESEINQRLSDPEYQNKKVSISYKRSNGVQEVSITDQGNGFDWRPYLEIEPSRATKENGRGIAKAKQLCFDSVSYSNNGRTVTVRARTQ